MYKTSEESMREIRKHLLRDTTLNQLEAIAAEKDFKDDLLMDVLEDTYIRLKAKYADNLTISKDYKNGIIRKN